MYSITFTPRLLVTSPIVKNAALGEDCFRFPLWCLNHKSQNKTTSEKEAKQLADLSNLTDVHASAIRFDLMMYSTVEWDITFMLPRLETLVLSRVFLLCTVVRFRGNSRVGWLLAFVEADADLRVSRGCYLYLSWVLLFSKFVDMFTYKCSSRMFIV